MRCFARYVFHSPLRKESLKSSLSQIALGILLSVLIAPVLWAQAPVGTISGTITDASGAVIKDASITVRNKDTGAERKVKSSEDGTFSAPALAAGPYEVTAQVNGFRTLLREVVVAVGTVATVDMSLEVGQTTEIVTVEAAGAAQINYESNSIDGVITRQKIQELPLNGRSFLQLAFLEPGVTASPGTTSQYNSLFTVSILGGESSKTAITVDGGNVRNSIEGNTGMNFSQEVVQEFQLSANNFDLSTGITSVGGVNIVTRTGGNEFHGSGYFFFRDHNMAAYPALNRNRLSSDPFFARRNPGIWVGGPIIKDRLHFFTNYEYTNQTSIVAVQPNLESASGLTGNFSSPYYGHLFSTRIDWNVTDRHHAFLRYSHDQNKGFGPQGAARLPSNWLQNKNFSDQAVIGLTSTLTEGGTVVNDFRFNFTYWQNRNLFADDASCPNCVGLGFPQLEIDDTNVTIGNTSNATQGRDLRRFTFDDIVSWTKGSHRFRFGTQIEYAPGTGFWGFCDPACTVGLSPEFIRSVVPAAALGVFFPKLPTTISSNQNFLDLPFAGGVVGVGDPAQPPPFNIDKAKKNNRLRFFGQDTWKIKPNFTLNYGLAWNFESTLVNRDLDKPRYLAPLYGSDLSPTDNNYNNFSPAFGFAWNVGKDSKTVVRAGAGVYWDTELLWRRLEERAAIGPIGNGRLQVPHTFFTNDFDGIVRLGLDPKTGLPIAIPVPKGTTLPAAGQLTNLTVDQFMQIVNRQIGAVQQRFGTLSNDLSVRNIELNKSAANLYPSEYPVQRSYQMNIGVQRELRRDMVLTVDYARRVFVNTLLGSLDYNRFNRIINGVQTPIIPRCAAADRNNPTVQCSNGPITFWTPGGREVYNGLLVKLDKRFSNRYLFTASYALSNRFGVNGISNLDNWFANYGPTGARHILNVSALVDLPWGVQVGFISAMSSRGPVMPSVSNVDLDGDGIDTTPIPGVDFNCFNRGCGKDDLSQAIAAWNQTFAGKKDAGGDTIPTLIDPADLGDYEFGDSFSSQDIRVTKKFTWKDRYSLSVFGEMFNVFNVANLGGYSFNLNNAANFGQPTNRASQVFGSGGPRALQLGARVSF